MKLERMRRRYRRAGFLERCRRLREALDQPAFTTDVIVGFPGETEEDFEFLLDWLEEAEIDRAGCFKYEPVTGAPANELEGVVPDEVKDERFAQLMEVAQNVSAGQLAKKVGRTIEVLVDDVKPAEGRAIARSKWDAPDIDGQVIVDKAEGIKPGDKVSVVVTGSDEYDLFAEPVAARAKEPALTH
jgi:ribosomal protein S12 methylthiotransferase